MFCCFFLRFDKAEGCKERNMNEKQEKKITIMKERRRREDEERRGREKKKEKRKKESKREYQRGRSSEYSQKGMGIHCSGRILYRQNEIEIQSSVKERKRGQEEEKYPRAEKANSGCQSAILCPIQQQRTVCPPAARPVPRRMPAANIYHIVVVGYYGQDACLWMYNEQSTQLATQ